MPTFKLNGKEIPFESGDTIMRAAWRQGVEIPHYCWHPGLSVAANCRMCLVHIQSGRQMALPILKFDAKKNTYVPDTKPKLMPACQVGVAPGMEVSSESDDVKDAQKHVQEFLLLNHPVDCPICDQAGECKLQDYYMEHHAEGKRKLTEPVHKPKGVRFGPTIVYDAERCIQCTRCIRVCDELVGDPVLDMRERGNRAEVVLSPGRELDHDYTLMTEHVCPVGALTSRDFRFKARVWFLKSAEGVCTGCARGCNTHIDYDHRNGEVVRLRPRDNMDVNEFWMCDAGMMTYEQTTQSRISTAIIGRGDKADYTIPEDGFEEAAAALKAVDGSRIGVVLSAHHSSEDNQAFARFAELLGTDHLYLAAQSGEKTGWRGDAVLKHADPNPNRAGAELAAGRDLPAVSDLLKAVQEGQVDAVIALGSVGEATVSELKPLADLKTVVCLTANEGALPSVASYVLPVTSWAECFGTFRNADGRDQGFQRAVPAAAGVLPAWQALSLLAAAAGLDLGYDSLAKVRSDLTAKAMPPTTSEASTASTASTASAPSKVS